MSSQSRLRSISSSLSFRLFLILFLSIMALSVVSGGVSNRTWYRTLEEEVKSEAYRAGDFIKQSLKVYMMENDREHLHRIIDLLGDEPGIEVIRIYNKKGEIKFSSEALEIGEAVDMQAEACYACHISEHPLQIVPSAQKTRIYTKGEDRRVLGLINPIENSESCSSAACHAHPPQVAILGVLDVQMSMEAADAALAAAEKQTYAIAFVTLLLAALLMAGIVYYTVYIPTKKLRVGTDALAKGDLDVAIDLKRSDELGALADSFNQMARSLSAADRELRAWSHALEDRVKEKTEELEEIHRQMVQVEKAASLGTMALTVAHELNNPLSGMLTYAKLATRKVKRLLTSGAERQSILDNLDIIQSESLRCGHIVRDLLTYARRDGAELRRARLHLLVDQALKLVNHHIELGGVVCEVDLQLADDSLVCDGDQIVQALIAILINAVEAMPSGGRLVVKTQAGTDPSTLLLSVSDTGGGIPEDALGRIFDPFFSTKDKAKGAGLGLAVVYGIVKRHGGTIAVDSAPGEGTTLTIQLPRDPRLDMGLDAYNRKDVTEE